MISSLIYVPCVARQQCRHQNLNHTFTCHLLTITLQYE